MTTPTADLSLNPIQGKPSPLRDWLSAYPLLLVALDPFTPESSWILDTADHLLEHYEPADVRVGWLVASDEDGAREFLGPLAEKYLTFTDPDRAAVGEFSLERLPALLLVFPDGSIRSSDGWDPKAWKDIVHHLNSILDWYMPLIPRSGDPSPYLGSPAKPT